MEPAVRYFFFVVSDERREPHAVSISEPRASGDDWGCEVEMTVLSGKRTIFGATEEQARELATCFAKLTYSQLKTVDGAGNPYSWAT